MLFSNLIQANLKTNKIGKKIEYYPRTESTNVDAWELIKSEEIFNGSIIITDNQFQGQGRNGHSWFMSPGKGIAVSIILIDKTEKHKVLLIPFLTAIGIVKALESFGIQATLKWPNDIFVKEKKLGGILCESKFTKNSINQLVIGIGLNVNEMEDDFPEELKSLATSCRIVTEKPLQREIVIAKMLGFIESQLQMIKDDTRNIINLWESYCNHIEKPISFYYNRKKLDGFFIGLDPSGQAIIKVNNSKKLFPSIIID